MASPLHLRSSAGARCCNTTSPSSNGNGVAELPHVLRPTALENILVVNAWRRQDSPRRNNARRHSGSAAYSRRPSAVVSGFQRLRRFVEWATRWPAYERAPRSNVVRKKPRAIRDARWLAPVSAIASLTVRHDPPTGSGISPPMRSQFARSARVRRVDRVARFRDAPITRQCSITSSAMRRANVSPMERPRNTDVGTKADNENALASLRNAVVSCIEQSPHNTVS